MAPEVRRQEVMRLVMERDSVTVRELAERFSVSAMTVHRDLDALEARGVVRKVHGGATAQPSSLYESALPFRLGSMTAEKERIARRASQYVKPGSSVIVDDSTTAGAMAPLLAHIPQLTVVTNFLYVVEALRAAETEGLRMILLGGAYDPKYESTGDLLAERALGELRVDCAFLSASAADAERGVFHQDAGVARLKRAMIGAAAVSFLLVDSAKFDKRATHRVAGYESFEAVITDDGCDPRVLSSLRQAGHRVETA